MKNKLFYFSKCFLLILFLIEITFRFYNPFQTRLKGSQIVLPINRSYVFENTTIQKLDRHIVHTKNSLGFRGKEQPTNWSSTLSLITVGSSAVECFYLSDNQTWPFLIEQNLKPSFPNLWINNAGLDGHSTFGHRLLLEDVLVKLHPRFILFMVGDNDIGREDLNQADAWTARGKYKTFGEFLWENSEVLNLISLIRKNVFQKPGAISHQNFDFQNFQTLVLPEEKIKASLDLHYTQFLPAFKKRVFKLIEICKENNILPIFMSQPSIWGRGIDIATRKDLSYVKLSESENGELHYKTLQLYNQTVHETCSETATPFIDLAALLPINSNYFYDGHHFTPQGAAEVAKILSKKLPIIFKTAS